MVTIPPWEAHLRIGPSTGRAIRQGYKLLYPPPDEETVFEYRGKTYKAGQNAEWRVSWDLLLMQISGVVALTAAVVFLLPSRQPGGGRTQQHGGKASEHGVTDEVENRQAVPGEFAPSRFAKTLGVVCWANAWLFGFAVVVRVIDDVGQRSALPGTVRNQEGTSEFVARVCGTVLGSTMHFVPPLLAAAMYLGGRGRGFVTSMLGAVSFAVILSGMTGSIATPACIPASARYWFWIAVLFTSLPTIFVFDRRRE